MHEQGFPLVFLWLLCLLLVFFLFSFLCCYFFKYFIVPCGTQQPQELHCKVLPVCAVFSCVQTMVWLPEFGTVNVRTDDVHVIAHGGCTDTENGFALKADFGRKIPCFTRDSNPRQYYAWLFSWTLYQLSNSLVRSSYTYKSVRSLADRSRQQTVPCLPPSIALSQGL